VLGFARGPLFKAALWFFVLGMLFRLIQALRFGWRHKPSPVRRGGGGAVARSFLHGLFVLPFIPGLRGVFRRNPVIYIAGGLFHVGLLVVVFFSRSHMLALKGILRFGWPVLPTNIIHPLAAVAIVAMLALLIHRVANPVMRLISGPAEWLNWVFVFLPMATGFVLAAKWWLPYQVMFSLHMLLVDFLLVWIPLSRISHFIFYFFSRTVLGTEFGRSIETT